MRIVILIPFLLLYANILQAQEDSLLIKLGNIVIKENRIEIPFSDASRNIELITRVDIDNSKATSVNELLQTIGGLDVRQRGVNGVQADLSIRGGTFEQALVLINGVKMIDPQTGHHMMNLPVSLEDIERIEVLKGPAARIYGQNGFAGAINIVTKNIKEFELNIGLEAGSYGLLNGTIKASLPIDNYYQSISYNYNSADGYRDNTDYDIHNIFYQSNANVADGELNIFGGYSSRDFGANGFYGNESFVDQYEEVNTSILSIGYEKKFSTWKVTPRFSWRKNYDNWQFLRQDPDVFQNFHTTHVVTGELNTSNTHALGILGIGIEYNNVDINSNNLGDHNRVQLGFHLENRFILAGEKLDITPGVYILEISDFGTQIYPGLDIGYHLGSNFKGFFNAGYTSRIPSFTDLYYEDRGNIGNPNLTEESAFTLELGLKYNTRSILFQASYFSRNARDLIDWFRPTSDDKWTPDNFAEANHNGIDLSSTFKISDNFLQSVRVNYLYLDASFEENDFTFSRNVLENLQHQLIINPIFNITEHVSLHFLLKYNDRVSLDNYTIVDANISYNISGSNIYIKASNLFDVSYRETNLVPMPGRWMVIGAKHRIN